MCITDLLSNIITIIERCTGRYLKVSVCLEYSQHFLHPSPHEPGVTQTLPPHLNHLMLWQETKLRLP